MKKTVAITHRRSIALGQPIAHPRLTAFGRVVAWGLALAFVAALTIAPAAARAEQAVVDTGQAKGAVILEAGGKQRIFEKDADQKLDVGGLVRLPALLYVCESVDRGVIGKDTVVTVSEEAAHVGGATAFLSAYEKIDAGALLKASVMITAGDAIYALAEACGGALALGAINERLVKLGVTAELATIDGKGVMLSADDLARLCAALAETGPYREYGGLYLDELTHEKGSKTELVNPNKLIKTCDGCFAGSTGSSTTGGYSGVFAVRRGGSLFICAVIGEQNAKTRTETAQRLIDAAFTSAKTIPCVKKGDVMGIAPVAGGMESTVDLVAAEDVTLLAFGEEKADTLFSVPDMLAAPVKAGQHVGYAEFTTQSGTVMRRVNLLAAKDIPSAGWGDFVQYLMRAWLHL